MTPRGVCRAGLAMAVTGGAVAAAAPTPATWAILGVGITVLAIGGWWVSRTGRRNTR